MAVDPTPIQADEPARDHPDQTRPRGGEAAAAASLDLDGNNIERRTILHPNKCKSRLCPKCGLQRGLIFRSRLLEKLHLFPIPMLFTLTVDPKRHTSEEAVEHVRTNHLISHLMRRLDVSVWVWVLEFQKSGMPHWHVLADASHLPRRKVDLKLAWHVWRDLWGIGRLDLQKSKHKQSPENFIQYLSKYLIKVDPNIPEWVYTRTKALRFVQGSKAVGGVMRDPATADQDAADDQQGCKPKRQRKPSDRRTIDRMARCEMTTRILAERLNRDTGELTYTYCGTLTGTPADLHQLASMGGSDLGIDMCVERVSESRSRMYYTGAEWLSRITPPDIAELDRRILTAPLPKAMKYGCVHIPSWEQLHQHKMMHTIVGMLESLQLSISPESVLEGLRS